MAFLTLKSGGGTTMNVGASTEFIRHYSIGNCLESPARGGGLEAIFCTEIQRTKISLRH